MLINSLFINYTNISANIRGLQTPVRYCLKEKILYLTGWKNLLGEQAVIDVIPKNLILHTTNRKPRLLLGAASVNNTGIVGHVPIPGVAGIGLCSTPPVTDIAKVVECSTTVTVASRKGCKT
jgi:hypothetical protein